MKQSVSIPVMSPVERKNFSEERDKLYICLVDFLTNFIKREVQIEESDRFYEIVLHKFLYMYVQDIVTIKYVGHYYKPVSSSKRINIPSNIREYSNLRHNDSNFYRQLFNVLVSDVFLYVNKRKKIGYKRYIKSFLFKIRCVLNVRAKKVLLFSEYYPKYWSQLFANRKVIKVSLRTLDLEGEASVDKELRMRLFHTLQQEFDCKYIVNSLPIALPTDLLENFRKNYNSVKRQISFKNVDLMVSGWFPDHWNTILAAIGVSKGVELAIVQHGGGYGADEFHFMEMIERRISDRFYGWSLKEYNARYLPVLPTRLHSFKVRYDKLIEQESFKEKKFKILIADTLHYATPHIFDILGYSGQKKYLIDFISEYGDGQGTGIVVRLYFSRYAKNIQFLNELKSLFPCLCIHNETMPVEYDIANSELLYVNYLYSTFEWEANYVGREVKVLPGVKEVFEGVKKEHISYSLPD
ncbi:hypothetical protein [Roseivirga seohaensis]|uniref:hypothetical protein n=1 Tax=Roseivirga seohaensis TaxID=1914963 RepID=UPI003BAB57CF